MRAFFYAYIKYQWNKNTKAKTKVKAEEANKYVNLILRFFNVEANTPYSRQAITNAAIKMVVFTICASTPNWR